MQELLDGLKQLTLTPQAMSHIGKIDEFKGQWRGNEELYRLQLPSLERVASIASIGSSTRLEGATLSDVEISSLLSSGERPALLSPESKDVVGYAYVFRIVNESYATLPISEDTLKQFNDTLFRFNEKEFIHRGEYKLSNNHVEMIDEDGQVQGIRFWTSSPYQTPQHMSDLMSWMQWEQKKGEHHPLLLLALFVVSFLSVSPFQQGNGRLSRLVMQLGLLRAGYLYAPYCSLDSILEQRKKAYQEALEEAQSSGDRLQKWVEFFLDCLSRQVSLLTTYLKAEEKEAPLSKGLSDIVKKARRHERITMSLLEHELQVNRNTLKCRVRELVDRDYLEQFGKGKGTWYRYSRIN